MYAIISIEGDNTERYDNIDSNRIDEITRAIRGKCGEYSLKSFCESTGIKIEELKRFMGYAKLWNLKTEVNTKRQKK